jgi:Acyl-CoA dehydrogenase, C-terminal domain
MTVQQLTQPGELGELAALSIREIVSRATNGASIAVYAEAEPPLSWSSLADGGWDQIGIVDDDGGATLRDLVEVARVWGEGCIQLPLLPTIIAKRHSVAASDSDGPVTFAIPSATIQSGGLVPYGQHPGIGFATGLGAGDDQIRGVPDGEADTFDLLARGREVPIRTAFSAEAGRELAVLLAAEASGAALRMLNDGLAYAKQRNQFGKPIGSFQAVKHHLANALISSELAETAVIWVSVQESDAFRGALFAIDKSIAVGELVLQVHGGMGFTWDLGLHFYLRRMVSARDLVSGLSKSCA